MMPPPVAILSSGLVCGVGLNAPAACAAMRVGITGFDETRFMFAGEWLIGCPVKLEAPWRGREKLLQMIVPAIQECLASVSKMHMPSEIPLLLCLAEENRPGRFEGLDASFMKDVQARLGKTFHAESRVIANGRVGGAQAIDLARRLIAQGRSHCIVAGVDTFLVSATLSAYHEKMRLLTADNSDGFIPGEAGAAVLLGPVPKEQPSTLVCLGIGYGKEKATVESEEPLRGDGLAQAYKAAFADCGGGRGFEHVDYRIADVSGEQYGFKEAALGLSRTMRVRKPEFDIWHPADCIGEVGAAIVPCVLAVAAAAAHKDYAPGPGVLCHCGSDAGERAAMVLQHQKVRAA